MICPVCGSSNIVIYDNGDVECLDCGFKAHEKVFINESVFAKLSRRIMPEMEA